MDERGLHANALQSPERGKEAVTTGYASFAGRNTGIGEKNSRRRIIPCRRILISPRALLSMTEGRPELFYLCESPPPFRRPLTKKGRRKLAYLSPCQGIRNKERRSRPSSKDEVARTACLSLDALTARRTTSAHEPVISVNGILIPGNAS